MPTTRLDILKTSKLFINGAFPRSESGRSLPVTDASGQTIAHVAHASRKDLRDAVEAARAAFPKWSSATPYNRGQVLYRLAEMMEGKRGELAAALAPRTVTSQGKASRAAKAPSPRDEVSLAIDRLVHYAGWCDKHAQVLGCHNPVAGAYFNFTVPEPTGVVGVVCPDEQPLLSLVSLLAPVLVPGNTAVVVAPDSAPVASIVLAEAIATSDLPPGVVNILTGRREELLAPLAQHRDIDAAHAGPLPPEHARALREGIAENLKRVTIHADPAWLLHQGPQHIEPFVEFKTIWHPALA
jgi:acyl-CoA reductase-like NAD-dependent aldehyde dehydrogenase